MTEHDGSRQNIALGDLYYESIFKKRMDGNDQDGTFAHPDGHLPALRDHERMPLFHVHVTPIPDSDRGPSAWN